MAIEKLTRCFLEATRKMIVPRMIVSNRLLKSSSSVWSNAVNVGPNVTRSCVVIPQLTFSTTTQSSYAAKQNSFARKGFYDSSSRFDGLNPSNLKLGFEKIKELEDADEQVKKMFSLEFADDREIRRYRTAKMVEKVQPDPTNRYSLPVRIALTTLAIRGSAKQMGYKRKDKQSKDVLMGSIGRRRRLLKYLRRTDYERFERLLVELGITYTLPPSKIAFRKRSKRFMEKLTVWRKAREQRLEAMDKYLAEEREGKMREIAALKKDLGIDLTEEERKYLEDGKGG